MLPPLVRKNMDLPPPLTAPFKELCSLLPTTLTGNSLETPPPEVAASRLNAQLCGTSTVTPPPEVSRCTSSAEAAASRAEIEPPDVDPSTRPVTFSRLIPPPLVSTRVGP